MEITKLKAIKTNGDIAKVSVKIKRNENAYILEMEALENCAIKEVICFDGELKCSVLSKFYGDGYQKMSQYGGTLLMPRQLTYFGDKGHYHMPQTKDYHTSYNYVIIKNKKEYLLLGATSCYSYRTEFRTRKKHLIIAQCFEGKVFNKGDVIKLESIAIIYGRDKCLLFEEFAAYMGHNHKPQIFNEIPNGWCSWYCAGPNVTEDIITDNVSIISKNFPQLKYVQIDDGFQPFMGDWLLTGNKFTRPMKDICLEIKANGLEPAIWLAPFIASKGSTLFQKHSDWFIKDNDGNPLDSSKVTFGGWRDAPWYFLDPTNEDALNYIKLVFSTIKNDWGVKYFKLDANVWGGLPFGVRKDKNATSIEAYRRGMQAIWQAVGEDCYILGCNAPMWASLGLVSGMRITGDIDRRFKIIKACAKEAFARNWMHKKLWINDPDCILMADTDAKIIDGAGNVIKNKRAKNKTKMFKYENIYVKATGGVVLSGDYLNKLTLHDKTLLNAIIESGNEAAIFDDKFMTGICHGDGYIDYMLFNSKNFVLYKKTINTQKIDKAIDMYSGKILKCKEKLTVWLKPNSAEWIRVITKHT